MVYLSAEGRERLAAHIASSEPSTGTIELPPAAALKTIAHEAEPVIFPDLETYPLEREFGMMRCGKIRSFAAVPIPFERVNAFGTICLLDTNTLKLGAAELDNLTAFARDFGRTLEQRMEAAPEEGRAELTSEDFEALERLAVTDPLTGLSNRRGGEQNIASEISRARRQKTPLSCILLDIDRFKQVNDTYGHQAGDHVLREISSLLKRTVRAYDILVRWGGEEFLVVLPGVELEQARRLAERVRHAVETLETPGIGPVTVSAGAATLDTDYDFDEMLSLADRRLYQAKASGRNCIA
jgi:diguanylate cyclase (GGDEF)-like protein